MVTEPSPWTHAHNPEVGFEFLPRYPILGTTEALGILPIERSGERVTLTSECLTGLPVVPVVHLNHRHFLRPTFLSWNAINAVRSLRDIATLRPRPLWVLPVLLRTRALERLEKLFRQLAHLTLRGREKLRGTSLDLPVGRSRYVRGQATSAASAAARSGDAMAFASTGGSAVVLLTSASNTYGDCRLPRISTPPLAPKNTGPGSAVGPPS